MAGTDTKKQLLNLIRDFASENSQGERRVVGLRKRIKELESELEAANVELEEAKLLKETTEQEVNGFQLQLALNDTAIQPLELRISLTQDEISAVGSEVQALKIEQGALRDGFIKQMFQLNAKIRAFQQTVASDIQKDKTVGAARDFKEHCDSLSEADHNVCKKETKEVALTTLQGMLADIISQTEKEEKDYLEEENIQEQVLLELNDLEKKVSLMEAIMKVTKALQDLTSSDLEQTCSSLGEELQKSCKCPGCGSENVEALGGILQGN